MISFSCSISGLLIMNLVKLGLILALFFIRPHTYEWIYVIILILQISLQLSVCTRSSLHLVQEYHLYISHQILAYRILKRRKSILQHELKKNAKIPTCAQVFIIFDKVQLHSYYLGTRIVYILYRLEKIGRPCFPEAESMTRFVIYILHRIRNMQVKKQWTARRCTKSLSTVSSHWVPKIEILNHLQKFNRSGRIGSNNHIRFPPPANTCNKLSIVIFGLFASYGIEGTKFMSSNWHGQRFVVGEHLQMSI